MIIKTYRHKRARFDELIGYILSDKGRVNTVEYPTVFHNLHSDIPRQISSEFFENDKYRKKRKNGVVFYHEILSFSPEDKKYLTPESLDQITREYIRLRGDRSICLAQSHVENENIHVHFLFSGTNYKSAKTLRLNNQSFREVRKQMEAYQKTHFPKLEHSLVYENFSNIKNHDRFETEIRARGATSNKTELKELLHSLNSSTSFIRSVEQHPELELYEYRGKVTGVLYKGRKYRFKTLGISNDYLRNLELLKENQNSTRKRTESQEKDHGRSR